MAFLRGCPWVLQHHLNSPPKVKQYVPTRLIGREHTDTELSIGTAFAELFSGGEVAAIIVEHPVNAIV